jgi:hypothetical protein
MIKDWRAGIAFACFVIVFGALFISAVFELLLKYGHK